MPADVSHLLALADDFDKAGRKIARAVVESVTEAADVGVATAKAGAPRRTGTLAGSIDRVVSGSGGAAGASARVRATARYGWYVYAGTARMAPEPAFLDDGRDAAEKKLESALPDAIAKAMP